jgi:hemerythrin superfamily protein
MKAANPEQIMAKRKTRSKSSRSSRGKTARSSRAASSRGASRKSQDAIALLKADHRQVEGWFEEFESSRSASKKQDLANRICTALKAHTMIEEEIFYPAFLEATGDEDIHHEAEVEHDGAKKLIADIEKAGPDDDYFDARMSVLAEMVKHHVREEEKRDGMFGKARQADMDLDVLGQELASRKAQIMGQAEEGEDEPAPSRRRSSDASDRMLHARAGRRFRGE